MTAETTFPRPEFPVPNFPFRISRPEHGTSMNQAERESEALPAGEGSPVAAKKAAPKKPKAPELSWGEVARRKFVWWSFAGFFGACAAATLRFFYPRALFEPKSRFAVGYPDDFGFGVSTRFQQSNRIWVVRDSSRIYVIFANCTHLGCTPDWSEAENKFKCPCHGSGFDTEGINFEGPAPKPLLRVHLEEDAEGRIVVDTSILYESNQWKEPGAFLPV